MNLKTLSVLNVSMFLAGIILIYSGIKGYKPQTVLSWALGGPKPTGWETPNVTPKVAPGDHPGDMPWTYPQNGTLSGYQGNITNPVAGGNVGV